MGVGIVESERERAEIEGLSEEWDGWVGGGGGGGDGGGSGDDYACRAIVSSRTA